MKAKFTVDTEAQVVFSQFAGRLTYDVVVDHMVRLKAVPEFLPEFRQLIDFQEVNEVDASSDEVRALAERTIFSAPSRRAFLVKTDLQFGLCRMFATHRDLNGEPNIAVFRKLSEACRWIDCDEEYASDALVKFRVSEQNA